MKILVVVPTLGRATLRETLAAVDVGQLRRPDKVVEVRSSDVPTTVMDLARAMPEYGLLAVADDDAMPQADWLERAERYFEDPRVGYVCGALTPGPGTPTTPTQDLIARVQASPFGSFRSAVRYRRDEPAGETDELGVHGMGVYRREAYLGALAAVGNVPMAGWEDHAVTWMRANGWAAIRDPELTADHAPRGSWLGFARQMFKAGSGRAVYFKIWPHEALAKPWFIAPSAFLVSLFIPWLNVFTFAAYAAAALAYSRPPGMWSYFFACHLGYGAGFLWGFAFGRRGRR